MGSLGIWEETVKHPMEALDPARPQEVLRTLLGILRMEAFFSHHKLSCWCFDSSLFSGPQSRHS